MELFVSNRITVVLLLVAAVVGGVPIAAAYIAWWNPWCNFLAGFLLTVVSGAVLLYNREQP